VSIYYTDESITLHHGDALEVARTLPTGSVNCIVTSPPYYHQRDYGDPAQYGQEATVAEYVERLRALFAECRRLLANDGTLWLNLGDTYEKNKNLLGIPWRVAIALQDDGWILRNDNIWSKIGMPESVTDRLAVRHEHIFLFAKSPSYYFNLDAIRGKHATSSIARQNASRKNPSNVTKNLARQGGMSKGMRELNPKGSNPGDVWNINTDSFHDAHFATFPVQLPQRCILAGCKPGGTVLDPFHGSGTTGSATGRAGCRYIGIDIKAEYLKLSLETRLFQPTLGEDIEAIDSDQVASEEEPPALF
jgi:DNA modification methylase